MNIHTQDEDNKEVEAIAETFDLEQAIDKARAELKANYRRQLEAGAVNPMIKGACLNSWERGFLEAVALILAKPDPETAGLEFLKPSE